MANELVLISGSAHPEMGKRIAENLNIRLLEVEVGRFSDGEINIKILENIRGTDVFIIQPTMPPAENIMELLLMIDAVRRASCRRVTAVIPYFGYARQDRKDQPRVPIGAKLMADLITGAGANRVLTIDLHAPQIQGFFNIPLDHLYSAPVLLRHFDDYPRENLTVVAPDAGSIKMTRAFAKRLNADLAIIDKRRPHLRRHDRYGGYPDRCRPGLHREPGSPVGDGLLYAPLAVRPLPGAPQRFAHQGGGGQQHHPLRPVRCLPQDPGAGHGSVAGPSHRTDPSGKDRQRVVRLTGRIRLLQDRLDMVGARCFFWQPNSGIAVIRPE